MSARSRGCFVTSMSQVAVYEQQNLPVTQPGTQDSHYYTNIFLSTSLGTLLHLSIRITSASHLRITFTGIMISLPSDFGMAAAAYAVSHLIPSIILGFTGRSSPARPAAFVSMIALAISLQNIVTPWANDRVLSTMFSVFTWLNVFTALDLFFYTNATYSEHVHWLRGRNVDLVPTLKHRINWALQMPINYRRVGTKWQISQIPPFDPEKPGFIPSRTTFLLYRLLETVLVLGTSSYFWANPITSDVRIHFTEEQQKVILNEYDLSIRALPSRIYLVASYIITVFTGQTAQYAAASILPVLLRFSDPQDWPVIQGPVSGSWSVRRLWGSTWHQCCRQLLSANADFVTFSVLGLNPRTVLTRYTRYFLCFFQSGAMHVLFDQGSGITPAQTGALLFFTIQPIAFGIEELAQWLSKRYNILTEDGPLRRLIAYVWVAAWCTLTWPIWVFPQFRNMLAMGMSVTFIHLNTLI
ncbi:membrane bound O-acyl transferase family-domain-containing protein [Aspergillus aurantiobrunneus]